MTAAMATPPSPTIESFMTPQPMTIGQEQTLETAASKMRELKIRHLPVLHGGRIVGIVTERDVALVETLPDVDPATVRVEEAMTAEPYLVEPHAALADVARTMAEHKYGAAVVAQGGKVVGVFTTVDACRALASVLSS